MFLLFFNDTATTKNYTLSLHDALPICYQLRLQGRYVTPGSGSGVAYHPLNDGTQSTAAPATRATFVAGSEPGVDIVDSRSEEHTSELQSRQYFVCRLLLEKKKICIFYS